MDLLPNHNQHEVDKLEATPTSENLVQQTFDLSVALQENTPVLDLIIKETLQLIEQYSERRDKSAIKTQRIITIKLIFFCVL